MTDTAPGAAADIVNNWFRERLACGALARDTEAYNQVMTALPTLIEQLGGNVPPVATAGAPSAIEMAPESEPEPETEHPHEA